MIRSWLVDPRCFTGSVWLDGFCFSKCWIVVLNCPENAEIPKCCFQESPQVGAWAEGEREQLLFTFYLLWAGLNKWYCYADNVQALPVLVSTSIAQITLSVFRPSLFFPPGLHCFICFLLLLILGNVAPQRLSQGLMCSSPCPFTRRCLTTSASQTHFAVSLYLAANECKLRCNWINGI